MVDEGFFDPRSYQYPRNALGSALRETLVEQLGPDRVGVTLDVHVLMGGFANQRFGEGFDATLALRSQLRPPKRKERIGQHHHGSPDRNMSTELALAKTKN
jgi:hypothetical protein